jgi:hypothetical protein
MGWRLAVWAASCPIPRTHGEPCLAMWPWRSVRSQVAHLWGQAGPGAQLAGGGEATDVTDLGDQRHRRRLADAGSDPQRLDPGVGLGQRMNLPLQPGDGVARASSSPQQSWMIPRGIGGSSRSASQARLRARPGRKLLVGLLRGVEPRVLQVEELGLSDAELTHLFHLRLQFRWRLLAFAFARGLLGGEVQRHGVGPTVVSHP